MALHHGFPQTFQEAKSFMVEIFDSANNFVVLKSKMHIMLVLVIKFTRDSYLINMNAMTLMTACSK